MQMTKTQITELRGHMAIAGLTTRKVAEKFEVTVGAVDRVITGDSRSHRIQDFISTTVGYWPWSLEGRPE